MPPLESNTINSEMIIKNGNNIIKPIKENNISKLLFNIDYKFITSFTESTTALITI